MPEGRREPFKETFLCLQKKKKRASERETRNTETHNKVSGLAGRLAWNAQLWVAGGGDAGGQQTTRGTRTSGPPAGGPPLCCRAQSLGVVLPQGKQERDLGWDTWTLLLSTTTLRRFWERGPPPVSEDTVRSAPTLNGSVTSPRLPKSPDPEGRLETPHVTAWETMAMDRTCPGLEAEAGARRVPPAGSQPRPSPSASASASACSAGRSRAECSALAPTQGPRDPYMTEWWERRHWEPGPKRWKPTTCEWGWGSRAREEATVGCRTPAPQVPGGAVVSPMSETLSGLPAIATSGTFPSFPVCSPGILHPILDSVSPRNF